MRRDNSHGKIVSFRSLQSAAIHNKIQGDLISLVKSRAYRVISGNASYIRQCCGTRLRQTVFEAFRQVRIYSFVTFPILCYNRHVNLKGE